MKSTPHFNHKTLYPNSFERQKVNLVVNVFIETTISALKKTFVFGNSLLFTYNLYLVVNNERKTSSYLHNKEKGPKGTNYHLPQLGRIFFGQFPCMVKFVERICLKKRSRGVNARYI
jgi:hypothetical protein